MAETRIHSPDDTLELLVRRLQALVEFSQAVTSGIRLREDEVLELIHSQASKLMDTDNMYIALYDKATDTIRFGLAFVDGRRVDVEREKGWQPRRAGKGKTEEIIRTKKPLLHATRAEAEAWYAQPGHFEYFGQTFASWLGVPMMVGERVLGVIATYHPTQEYVYSKDDLAILQAMANQAAIASDNAHLFYDVNRRLEELLEFSQAVTSGIRLREDEILELIHKQASKLMDTNNMYVALYDEPTDTVRFGLAMVEGSPIDVQPRKAGKGWTEEIIRTKEPILIATKAEAEGWYDKPGHEGYLTREMLPSWMGVPMMMGEKVLGVIATYHPTRERVYSSDALEILQAMANQAAIALDNARFFDAERKRVAQLQALYEVSRELTASLDPKRVWSLILEKASQLTGAHRSTLQIIDEATGELVLHLVYPTQATPTDETFIRMPIGHGITGWVAQHRKPLLVQDVTQDDRYLQSFGDTRSELAVPLTIGDELVGVLNVEHPEVGKLDEQDLRLLTSFAGQAAIAIQNAERYEDREKALIALREEQTRRVAAERWQTLGQATTNLAHRMNNLAGIIPVCVQRIRERVEHEPTVAKNLNMIEQQAKFLLRLSADLLRPFTPSALRKFDVNVLMREALATTRPILEDQGIQVALHWGENIPKVRIRRLLSEAFVELITNAVKAMPEGGELTIETKLSDDNMVEILFTDTGCGIPAKRQSQLFQLFDGGRWPTGEPEGPGRAIGFGLWWVRTFVQQWGGDVALLQSEVGKGSTFVIRLPVEG